MFAFIDDGVCSPLAVRSFALFTSATFFSLDSSMLKELD